MSEATASAPASDAGSAPVQATAPTPNQAPAPTEAPTPDAPSADVTQSQPAPVGDLLSPPSSSAEVADGGGLNPSEPKHWLDGVSHDLRDNPNINKYQSQEDLLIAFNNQSKMLGQKGLVKPDADAPQEVKEAWLDHMGRPVNPDGYEEFKPKVGYDLEGKEVELYKLDPELYKGAKEMFHSLGIDQEGHDKLMNFLVDYELGQHQQTEQYNADMALKGINQLKSEYGAEYDAKIRSAVNIADQLGIRQLLLDKGLGSDPDIIRMLADGIGGKIGESRLTGDTVNSLDSIDKQIDSIREQLKNTPKSSPKYQELNRNYLKLYERKAGY